MGFIEKLFDNRLKNIESNDNILKRDLWVYLLDNLRKESK